MNTEEDSVSAMNDMPVPIPPRLDDAQLSACVIEAKRIAEEAMVQEQDDVCFDVPEQDADGGQDAWIERLPRRRAVHDEMMPCPPPMALEAVMSQAPLLATARHVPPNLHAAVLSFSARLLTYVNEKCGGAAPMVYKRAGVSRQIYSRIISHDDSTVDKRTAMLFCVGLQLEMKEAELLLKSAGYAFSGTLPEDRVFSYCIEKKIWNLLDINDILVECGLRPLTAEKNPYR